MRTVNFRDDVLWAAAYEIGLDPAVDLLGDQADAVASYVNAWVRRLYDTADYPEWTETIQFAPDAQHIVPWEAAGAFATRGSEIVKIGRVFKVYLVDPETTWQAVDTAFRLTDRGIHCGFEHGPYVWIKLMRGCPRFTAKPWNSADTYNKGQITYSPTTGNCHASKANGNRGHDPARESTDDLPLNTEQTRSAVPASPGIPEQPQTLRVYFGTASTGASIPAVPSDLSLIGVAIDDESGTTIGSTSVGGDGSTPLSDLIAQLAAQLLADPDLGGFAITTDGDALTMDISHASAFSTHDTGTAYYEPPPNNVKANFLQVVQVQPYMPSLAAASGTNQLIALTLTDDDVVAGATYQLDFRGEDGMTHGATYEATESDGLPEILAGILTAVNMAVLNDPFFETVFATPSPASSINFSTARPISLDALLRRVGSPHWDIVPFPMMIAEPVVRGVYANWLKEQGQTDKAQPEEEKVLTERGVRVGTQTTEQYDPLTDQQGQKSRYGVK